MQGWSIEGWTVFERCYHDIAPLRLTKNSDDFENEILKHERNSLEEQRIRSRSAYLLSKQCSDQEERNDESGFCCEMRIS